MICNRAAMLATVFVLMPALAVACPVPAGANAASAEIVRLINAERAKARLPALRASGKLDRAAQTQACDNAARRVFSHVGSDGSDLATRLKRSGYRYRTASENTGRGFAEAARMVNYWMQSPGHRSNILLPRTREIGVGLALSAAPESRNHWIAVMAASK